MNGSPAADTAAPTLSSAAVNGDTATLTYNERLDPLSVPDESRFSYQVDGGTAEAPTGVAISGKDVVLTLGSPVFTGQSMTVSYTKGNDANPVQDVSGNDAANVSSRAVTDNAPRELVTAATSVDGRTITLTFRAALKSNGRPLYGHFHIAVNGFLHPTSVWDAQYN